MTANHDVTATFEPIPRKLSVTIVGGGEVTGPDKFKCSSGTCEENYDHGTEVTLTAKAGDGYRFLEWSGCTSSTSNRCTVEMTKDSPVTATFMRVWMLTVKIEGSGTVEATGIECSEGTPNDCTEVYDDGTDVRLTAEPATGYRFKGWKGGGCTGASACTVKMTGTRNVTAEFIAQYKLTVTVNGPGSVTATNISCGGDSDDCTEKYDDGTTVKLTASSSSTHALTWENCDEERTWKCDVRMGSDKSVTATYSLSCPSGCEASTCGTTEVCKCDGASCPYNYARHGNCLAHGSRSCSGHTDGCGRSVRDTKCTVEARRELRDQAVDTCLYEKRDRSLFGCSHKQRICRPDITSVGCVYSPGSGPIDPGPIGLQDEEEWDDYEHGYILPTFECGAKANTCDVEFEDETLTTDDYGVVDKEDTNDEWRWECHSDNGTVRQCSASKDGG